MSQQDWNENYASGCLPWDTGVVDEEPIAMRQ